MEVPKNKREGTEVISMGVSEGEWRRRRLYLPCGGAPVMVEEEWWKGRADSGAGEFSGQRAR
jgi:hypothetical protein